MLLFPVFKVSTGVLFLLGVRQAQIFYFACPKLKLTIQAQVEKPTCVEHTCAEELKWKCGDVCIS